MRVMRVYHAGRDGSHRRRDRALVAAGVELHLVVPSAWPGGVDDLAGAGEPFRVTELPVVRPGDVNRHRYRSSGALEQLLAEDKPDVLDIHEEPFSAVARQWLRAAPGGLPVVMYTAQNVDKRFPPPFAHFERAALRRVAALYPCSRQAASVARGKGFRGPVEVLPLGYDESVFRLSRQAAGAEEVVLALVGRLVPEKGALDAVRVLARVTADRPARLVLAGEGPEQGPALALADSLGVADRVESAGWLSGEALAAAYRRAHVVLVPSTATTTWVEQFGRVIVEGQASGAVVAGYASGSIPEVAGEAAVLVPAGDVDRLARSVVELLADPLDYERRRQAGAALARERTWGHVAGRQAALYRAVAAGAGQSRPFVSSPRARRELARAEFGPTAETVAGKRPFALPVLRRGGVAAGAAAAVSDLAVELAALGAQRSRVPRTPR